MKSVSDFLGGEDVISIPEGRASAPSVSDFLGESRPAAAPARAIRTTAYSLGAAVGGPDEMQDKWTNRGYSSTGPNLVPGVVAVNEKVHPLGTVFRDVETGEHFLAADRHGNKDAAVVDIYAPPESYRETAARGRNLVPVGRVDKVPRTPAGVREVLAGFGRVPEGPSAVESLGLLAQGSAPGPRSVSDFLGAPELQPGEERPAAEVLGEPESPEVRHAGLINPTWSVLQESFQNRIPAAEPVRPEVRPVVRRATAADAGTPAPGAGAVADFLGDQEKAIEETGAALDFFGKIAKRWRAGRERAVDDQLAFRAAAGEVAWEDVADSLEPTEDTADAAGENFLSEGFLGAVEMVPAMIEGIVSGWETGLAGASAGALAAAAGGQMGPQIAAPEEILTVPGLAAGGWLVGNVAGSSGYWYRQGTGSMYHELRKEGVPHAPAQAVSAAFGVPYAAIEFAQVSKLIPGGSKALARTVGQAVKRRLARLARLAAETGVNYAEQIGQETGQELLAIGGEALAEWVSGVTPPDDKAGAWDRIKATILQTAASVPFLMAPRTAADVATVVRDSRANRPAVAPVRHGAGSEAPAGGAGAGQPAEAFMPGAADASGAQIPEVSSEWLGASSGDAAAARETARTWWQENRPEPMEVETPEFPRPVIVAWQGVKHATRDTAGVAEVATIPFLESLIPLARRVGVEPDKKGRNTVRAVHRLEVPVVFDGVPKTLGIVVRETTSGNFFYDSAYTKEPAGISGERINSDSGQPAAGSGRNMPPKPEAGKGEDFTREQATLPRAIEWVLPEQKGNPSPARIRRYLKRTLDLAIRRGMGVSRGARSALGAYRIRQETIRMRAMNDLPTLFHEVGHYLHYMLFPHNGDRSIAGDFAQVYDGELAPLGRVTSLPSYTPDQIRREGVAEWFRIWAADPAAARVAAPKFTAMFESTVAEEFPEIAKILASLQKQVRQYRSQPASAKAQGMIQWDPEDVDDAGPVGRIGEWLRAQYTAWVNELAPIDRAMSRLREFGLPASRAREVSERAANYKGGWRGKAEYDFEHAQTDLNGKEIGPSLKSILSQVPDVKEFATYAALKRAEEQRAKGLRTGFEDAMAAPDYNAMMTEWAKVYEPARKLLVKFTENQTLLLEQSGLISKKDRAAMIAANRDYVPFHRIVEKVQGGGGRKAPGFANVEAGIRRFKGSDMEIGSPLESIVKNGLLFRELAERNRVGNLFVAAVEDTQGGGRIGETVLRPLKTVNVTHEEVVEKLKSVGLIPPGMKLPRGAADLSMTIFRASDAVRASEGVFTIHRDGKPVSFQVEDKELLRALTLMDSADAEVFAKFPLLRAMRGFTNVLRKGATLTPEFLIRNPFRDQIIAGVYSRHGFIPFFDGFRGMLSALRKDDVYRAWVKSGGKYSGLYDVEQGDYNAALREAVKGNQTALDQALYLANPANVLKHLQYASEILESGTRISEFRRAKEQGASDLEAANDARDITLNFARNGYRGAVANKMVAFFNASIQDVSKGAREFRSRPVSTTLRAVALISVPSAFVWWLGRDDDEIQSLPEWRKSFFWNINLRQLTGERFILSVPKPFLLGALFGTSVEKALDAAYLDDPNATRKWFDAVIQNTLIRGDAGIPTAFKPLIEGMTNYSFFKDAPIENQAQLALSPGMRAERNTSVVARYIGGKLDVSPLLIDNTVRGYFGGLGKYGTDAIDWFLLSTRVADIPAPPAKEWQELPALRALVAGPGESTVHVGRFYDALTRAERRMRDFKTYGERMQGPEAAGFWRRHRNELAFYSAGDAERSMMTEARRVRDQLAEINKAMSLVRNDRKMSPAAKLTLTRQLQEQRDTLARLGFEKLFHPTDKKAVR